MDKQRFKQLYALAHGGDMNAKADLWLEFEFAYDHDPLPDFMREPSLGRACSPNAPPPSATPGVPQAASLPCEEKAVADQQINNRKSEIKNADLPKGGRP